MAQECGCDGVKVDTRPCAWYGNTLKCGELQLYFSVGRRIKATQKQKTTRGINSIEVACVGWPVDF